MPIPVRTALYPCTYTYRNRPCTALASDDGDYWTVFLFAAINDLPNSVTISIFKQSAESASLSFPITLNPEPEQAFVRLITSSGAPGFASPPLTVTIAAPFLERLFANFSGRLLFQIEFPPPGFDAPFSEPRFSLSSALLEVVPQAPFLAAARDAVLFADGSIWRERGGKWLTL